MEAVEAREKAEQGETKVQDEAEVCLLALTAPCNCPHLACPCIKRNNYLLLERSAMQHGLGFTEGSACP